MDALTPDEKLSVIRELDSEDWLVAHPSALHDGRPLWTNSRRRKWTNTEIVTHDVGLLLSSLQQSQIDLVWALFESSLSQNGFAKVKNAVDINKYLGTLANTPAILNEYNYKYGHANSFMPWFAVG